MTRLLITGGAGFIGMHLALKAHAAGFEPVAIDNLDPSNDFDLKVARVGKLREREIPFAKADITDRAQIARFFRKGDVVVHLAAQAGIRRHADDPDQFFNANVIGTQNILELARRHECAHLILASSSSVFDSQADGATSEDAATGEPRGIYAATKRSGELLSYAYSQIYRLPITVTRLFSVYGSFGRGDMAPLKFAREIRAGKTLTLHEPDKLQRDFTHVDDVVTALLKLADLPPTPWRVVNIGRGQPVSVNELVSILENTLGVKALTTIKQKELSEVDRTWACNKELKRLTGFEPLIDLRYGIKELVDWLGLHEPLRQNERAAEAYT